MRTFIALTLRYWKITCFSRLSRSQHDEMHHNARAVRCLYRPLKTTLTDYHTIDVCSSLLHIVASLLTKSAEQSGLYWTMLVDDA
eukprot:5307277-Amphidinium_carterae.2